MTDSLLVGAPESTDSYTAEEVRRYYVGGDWQHRVLFDVLRDHAAAQPDAVFVTDGTVSLSYGALAEQALRLAAALQSLGVERGDRVAVQMPNWAEFVTITAAVSRLGAVLVPIMPIMRHEEVGYTLAHSGAKVIIGPERHHKFDYATMYRELRERSEAPFEVVIARPTAAADLSGVHALESLYRDGDINELDAALGAVVGADELALIVYTSGTTARPKGCMHTFNTLHACAVGMIRRMRIDQDDVFFNPSPVCHSTGLVTGLVMPLLIGASTHFMPEWNPADGLRRIAEYGCTTTFTSTTFLTTLMQAYDETLHDMSSMRYWVCAGAPIPGPVVENARRMFPTCGVLSLYGRSENMTTVMCGPDDPVERSVTSDGRALEGASVIVVDADGLEVPRGQAGDLAYRGPSHMLGYFRDPEHTAELYTPDGYSRSGDLGTMDEAGFVRVQGRVKDIIIRGGINISAREVEDLLITHDAVRDAAVVSMPDDRLGERACAFVILRDGAAAPSLRELTDFLRSKQIAVQKLPERLEIVDEFPMTPVGKVRKNVLRQQIAAIIAAEIANVSAGA